MGSDGFNKILLEIFNVPRVLGSFPFDGRFHLSKTSMAASFVVRSAMAYVTFRLGERPDGHPLMTSFSWLYTLGCLLSCVLTCVCWLIKRKTVHKTMKKVNRLLNDCPDVRFRKNRPRYTRFVLVSMALLFVLNCCCSYSVLNWRSINERFNDCLSCCITSTFISQYLEMVHLLRYILREGESGAFLILQKCYSTLQELDCVLYNPLIFIAMTQHFIQIIKYLFILFFYRHLHLIDAESIWQFLSSIVPLVIITCSHAMAKYQALQLGIEIWTRMAEDKCQPEDEDDSDSNGFENELFSFGEVFNPENALVLAIVSAFATSLVIQFYFNENYDTIFLTMNEYSGGQLFFDE